MFRRTTTAVAGGLFGLLFSYITVRMLLEGEWFNAAVAGLIAAAMLFLCIRAIRQAVRGRCTERM